MAATAMLMSWTIPLDKMAVRHATAPFHGLVLTVGIGAGSLAVLAAQGRWSELAGIRHKRGAFVLALVSSTLALAFQLFVLKFLLVGLIEALKRGIGNLMAMLLGRMVFGEPVTVGKMGAVLLMAFGVLLILV
jgi:multidrug transporter EmrE-like cation transporter